jgi:hypothetical protein
MSGLRDYLFNQDIGVSRTGHGLHIGVSLAEAIVSVAEASHIVIPTVSELGVATIGGATIGGVVLAGAGPVLGMTGVFMALGSGYAEARAEIQNEAVASGFSQGFVAGLLNMSPTTVSFLFAQHGVIHRNEMDPEADVLEMKARNRGLVAGYAMANQAPPEDKKAYIFEIREFTGKVSAGEWTDRDKKDYVITYAAKLRLHFMNA